MYLCSANAASFKHSCGQVRATQQGLPLARVLASAANRLDEKVMGRQRKLCREFVGSQVPE